jgi:hypothetical protein
MRLPQPRAACLSPHRVVFTRSIAGTANRAGVATWACVSGPSRKDLSRLILLQHAVELLIEIEYFLKRLNI